MKGFVRSLLERRHARLVLAFIATFTLGWRLLAPILGPPTPGCVLIVGDFSNPESVANQILRGLNARQQELPSSSAATIRFKQCNEAPLLTRQGPDVQQDISSLVLDEMASEPILAVIVASTSKSANSVLRVASTLNRPCIVAVASENELLQDDITRRGVIRLIPSNRAQGRAIAGTLRPIQGKLVIFADSSPYAAEVVDSVYDELRGTDTLTRTTLYVKDVPPSSDLIRTAEQASIIVSVGYEPLASHIYRTIAGDWQDLPRGARPQLVFSDAAIPLIPAFQNGIPVSIVYPRFSVGSNNPVGPADGAYIGVGKLCFNLIHAARDRCSWSVNYRRSFFNFWTDQGRVVEGQVPTFDASGEATSSRWDLLELPLSGNTSFSAQHDTQDAHG